MKRETAGAMAIQCVAEINRGLDVLDTEVGAGILDQARESLLALRLLVGVLDVSIPLAIAPVKRKVPR